MKYSLVVVVANVEEEPGRIGKFIVFQVKEKPHLQKPAP